MVCSVLQLSASAGVAVVRLTTPTVPMRIRPAPAIRAAPKPIALPTVLRPKPSQRSDSYPSLTRCKVIVRLEWIRVKGFSDLPALRPCPRGFTEVDAHVRGRFSATRSDIRLELSMQSTVQPGPRTPTDCPRQQSCQRRLTHLSLQRQLTATVTATPTTSSTNQQRRTTLALSATTWRTPRLKTDDRTEGAPVYRRTRPTHYERVPPDAPNSHQQPRIATSSMRCIKDLGQ
jgi:hypothetical protein